MKREFHNYTTNFSKSEIKFDAKLLFTFPPEALGVMSVAAELRSWTRLAVSVELAFLNLIVFL